LGDRLCDLSYANPYEGVQQSTRAVLRRTLDRERLLDLQYSPFGGQTLVRRAIADDLNARQQLPYRFQDVILTPGAMAALHLALRSIGEPGDEVIIPVPCWLDYPLYAHYLGLTPKLVPLTNPGFLLDVAAIDEAISSRTSGVLLSNPSNPAGRSYTRESLTELSEVLSRSVHRTRRPITLVADETHRDFTDPVRHQPAAELWPATITVYSFGKYHFIQGQRIGYLAVSPRHPERASLSADLVRWARITGFCTPTALMQAAVPELLTLQHDLSQISRWRNWLTEELCRAGYQVTQADATLFVYVATPGGQDDLDFIRKLAEAGVLALPAPVFHHRGHFRLALTGGERMLEGAVSVLCRMAAT
jgi:aspartate aminotransferase